MKKNYRGSDCKYFAVNQAVKKMVAAYRPLILCGLTFLLFGGWMQGISNSYAEPQQSHLPSQKEAFSNEAGFSKDDRQNGPVGAQFDKSSEAKLSKKRYKIIDTHTREYIYALYKEDWRIKVERIGHLNFPEEAKRNNIRGTLTLSVSINADGTLENVEIIQSSGYPVFDDAAIRIVKLASPFSPFHYYPGIAQETDVITIVNKWTFDSSQENQSKRRAQ